MADETPEAVPALTIWEALDAWSKELAPWQQYIVGKAAGQGKVKREEIDEAYRLFQLNKKLAVATEGEELPEIPAALGRPAEALTEKLLLKSVDNMVGINALPEGAQIKFGEGLTIIYGENGAGKTGFSRLLSNACFSRQKPNMLGDIYLEEEPPEQTATFHVSVGATEQAPITFPVTEEGSPLKRITVFDSAVARHHLTQTTAFTFKPAGFDVFPEIGRVYGILAEKVDAEIAQRTKPNEFPNSFGGSKGIVYETILGLNADTDMDAVRALATYGKAESERIDAIEAEISKLRNQASPESLDSLREAKRDVDALAGYIARLEPNFTSEATDARALLIAKVKETAVVASTLGADQFKRPFFTAVGSREWESFAQGVHSLAKKESADYPATDGHCLLCERPLDAASHEHIKALLTFVEGEARTAATTAAEEARLEKVRLQSLNLDFFSAASRAKAHVHRLDVGVESAVDSVMEGIKRARDIAIADLESLETKSAPLAVSGVADTLTDFGARIEKDITQLEGDKSATAIEALEDEKRVLRHRQVLTKLLPQVEEFVVEAQWVKTAALARGALDTRTLTYKEKALSDQIITDGYRAKLAEECKALSCELPVELKTTGQRGETVKALTMPKGYKPEDILSEGEQKAIALADFLAEVALNPAAAGIVLDDPVSSQDHKRKAKIAERLVEEAKTRQVIVFTHDLVFLNRLHGFALDAEIPLTGHWVERFAGKPGYVVFDDLPVTSKTYEKTTRAKAFLEEAKAAHGSDKEDALMKCAGALRTTLEETVIKKLFKEVVTRWDEQVRVTALRKVNWDNDKAEEICCLVEDLSRFIDAHTHSDEAKEAPTQEDYLEGKIAEVDALISWATSNRP